MIDQQKKETKSVKLRNSDLDAPLNAADMALSSLQCPSPPPILNMNVSTGNNVSSQSINDTINSEFRDLQQHEVVDSSKNSSTVSLQEPRPNSMTINDKLLNKDGNAKSTVPAGGALLRDRVAAAGIGGANAKAVTDRLRPVSPATVNESSPLQHLTDHEYSSPLGSNQSTSSLSSTDPLHHHQNRKKSPDIHAHFYLEDTIRHGGVRSRSNSTSTNNDFAPRNIRDVLDQHEASQSPTSATQANSSIGKFNSSKKEALQNLDPRLPQDDGKIHILFGSCGSVGSSKIKLIIKKLEEIYGKDKLSIQLILTSAAEHFFVNSEFGPNIMIWRDSDEWSTWKSRSDPVLHIELRRWADILIVAPLTANTLSKLAIGICDNLLTNVLRAWNTQYPVLLAPSMVKYAYNSAPTRRHLKTIKEEMPWIEVLKPVEKIIGSYGDIGMGGMMDHNEIVDKVVHKLGGYPEEEDGDDDNDDDNDNKDADDDDDDDDDDDEDEDEDEDDDNDTNDNEEIAIVEQETEDQLKAT
jgi:hypothetical protein